MSVEKKNEPQHPAKSMLAKALFGDDNWDEECLCKIVYWFKHVVAVVFGLSCGILGITGATGILGFLFASNFGAIHYYSGYLGVDDEEFGGKSKFINEGLMPSFSLFLLIWIYFYTASNAPEMLMNMGSS